MKKIIIIIPILTIIFAFNSLHMYDNQYHVIKIIDEVEIREYSSAIYASYSQDITNQNSQFKVLANYIFGGNRNQEKIGMTSPVNMIQSEKKEMLFRMPSRYDMQTLPTPSNNDIQIFKMAKRKVAALQFSGYATSSKVNQKKQDLITILKKFNIEYSNKFEVLVYNSPYKIFNRRNEIIVVL